MEEEKALHEREEIIKLAIVTYLKPRKKGMYNIYIYMGSKFY